MKIDILKVAQAALRIMHVVQKVADATGDQKAEAVIESIPETLEAIEAGIGKDILDDPAVAIAAKNLLASYKAFHTLVDAARHVKASDADR